MGISYGDNDEENDDGDDRQGGLDHLCEIHGS